MRGELTGGGLTEGVYSCGSGLRVVRSAQSWGFSQGDKSRRQYVDIGGRVANVVKALALVVCNDPVGVRVLAVAATKMDVEVTHHRRWPNSPKQDVSGRQAK